MTTNFVFGNPFFPRNSENHNQYPYLSDNIETDVIIVGGGITGAILSYYFSKKGINCTILEKKRIGYCSTSATTAILQYELDGCLKALEAKTSYENVIKSYKLCSLALNEIAEFAKLNGNDFDYFPRDNFLYTSKKIKAKELEEEYKIRKENGFDVEFITPSNNTFPFKVEGGVYSFDAGAELNPYKFTQSLINKAIDNNARIFENTEVKKVQYLEDSVEVITEYDFKVKGKILVLATGYDTSIFTNRKFGSKYITYSIVTKPIEDLALWPNRALVRDIKVPYNYFRTTNDNRIIFGGEDVPFETNITNKSLAKEKYNILENNLRSLFSDIPNIEIEYKFGGAFNVTPDDLGFIGRDPKNPKLWYCLGYGANGILFSILGGMMLSDMYLGNSAPDLDLFKINRFDK